MVSVQNAVARGCWLFYIWMITFRMCLCVCACVSIQSTLRTESGPSQTVQNTYHRTYKALNIQDTHRYNIQRIVYSTYLFVFRVLLLLCSFISTHSLLPFTIHKCRTYSCCEYLMYFIAIKAFKLKTVFICMLIAWNTSSHTFNNNTKKALVVNAI